MANDNLVVGVQYGVCSECQNSGIELISEDTELVLQDHDVVPGTRCNGSYGWPEAVYTHKEK